MQTHIRKSCIGRIRFGILELLLIVMLAAVGFSYSTVLLRPVVVIVAGYLASYTLAASLLRRPFTMAMGFLGIHLAFAIPTTFWMMADPWERGSRSLYLALLDFPIAGLFLITGNPNTSWTHATAVLIVGALFWTAMGWIVGRCRPAELQD
jgi:hypothetical protein